MIGFARFLLTITCLFLASVLHAETTAILIGVADYDDETGIADLRGPPNDVRLIAQALQTRGVENIVLLADGIDGAPRPTRNAILETIAAVTSGLSEGDFVYLHMSGHGTQQKDVNGDETDGLDEVFLPADTAQATPGTGLIRNAIVDDEIGSAVAAMRAKGANVWLVMDSCNSGSGLRAGAPTIADRYVDPALLGAGAVPRPGPNNGAGDVADVASGGDVVAFYAAQSSEVARELDLTGEGDWYGLFSSRLAARLESGAALTFRQLFQGIMRDMNDQAIPGAARMQTPQWQGSLIDAAVFGGRDTIGVNRYSVTADEVLAGRVHGLTDGTLLALVADIADPADSFIGFAQMEDTTATRAFLRPVAQDCAPKIARPCAVDGTIPDAARFAQVIDRPVDLAVKLSPPIDMGTGEALDAGHVINQALQEGMGRYQSAGSVPLVLDPTHFEIETLWDGQALWLGPRTAIGSSPVGLRWAPEDGGITSALTRIAKAEHLARLLADVGGVPSLLNPSPIKLNARHAPVPATALAPLDAEITPRRECRTAIAQRDAAAEADLLDVSTVKQCDGISIAAQGLIPGAFDLNRVHIDAQYCIHARYERIEDTQAARLLGEEMTICSDCPGGYSAGDERLFVIVTEAENNQGALNLEGLVENCGPDAAGTRGQNEINAFMTGLNAHRATRGNMGAAGIANIWVAQFNWAVLPKPEVFRRYGLN